MATERLAERVVALGFLAVSCLLVVRPCGLSGCGRNSQLYVLLFCSQAQHVFRALSSYYESWFI
jgi:hypothetical protein